MTIKSVIKASIFDCPENSVLIHACNAIGNWNAGVALQFKNKYPNAYIQYANYCSKSKREGRDLSGKCLLIKPDKDTYKQHWIACLFTSYGYGREVDEKDKILENTKLSVSDLNIWLEVFKSRYSGKEKKYIIGECYSVRINNGLFKVEWKLSKQILEDSSINVTITDPTMFSFQSKK